MSAEWSLGWVQGQGLPSSREDHNPYSGESWTKGSKAAKRGTELRREREAGWSREPGLWVEWGPQQPGARAGRPDLWASSCSRHQLPRLQWPVIRHWHPGHGDTETQHQSQPSAWRVKTSVSLRLGNCLFLWGCNSLSVVLSHDDACVWILWVCVNPSLARAWPGSEGGSDSGQARAERATNGRHCHRCCCCCPLPWPPAPRFSPPGLPGAAGQGCTTFHNQYPDTGWQPLRLPRPTTSQLWLRRCGQSYRSLLSSIRMGQWYQARSHHSAPCPACLTSVRGIREVCVENVLIKIRECIL